MIKEKILNYLFIYFFFVKLAYCGSLTVVDGSFLVNGVWGKVEMVYHEGFMRACRSAR